MKIKLTYFVTILFFIYVNIIPAQTPTYNLKATNFLKTSSNSFVFDIYIQHTNDSVYFEYSGGQYFFDINSATANGGILSYNYVGPDTSDLPFNLRPRNPQALGSQLRLATNTFPAAGSGFIMTNNGNPGTKIVKMKVSTSAAAFANIPVNLKWRNQLPDPFTKIYAYVASINKNITSPFSHIIDSTSLYSIPIFNLTAKNFNKLSANILEFEIYIKHTNSPVAFEYSGGQYFFDFNPAIANGGVLSYSYAGDTSALPLNLRPRNPQVSGSQLRLATNTFPVPGGGYVMTNNDSAGTKIVKMRLSTTSASFSNVPLHLSWKNQLPDPYTKIYAFTGVLGNYNTNISSSATYSIDSTLTQTTYNIKLAVEGLYRVNENILFKNDYVSAVLRNSTPPYNIMDSASAIIDSINFTGNYLFNTVTSGKYYIVIRYKNSIDTWSREGGDSITNGGIYDYDFTTVDTNAYGSNMILKGSTYCIYSGDVNFDNFCDLSDLELIDNDSFHFISGNVITDLNGDYTVDLDDLTIEDNNSFSFVGTVSP